MCLLSSLFVNFKQVCFKKNFVRVYSRIVFWAVQITLVLWQNLCPNIDNYCQNTKYTCASLFFGGAYHKILYIKALLYYAWKHGKDINLFRMTNNICNYVAYCVLAQLRRIKSVTQKYEFFINLPNKTALILPVLIE